MFVAIILAGGFGMRLRSVLPHAPKPMAPINDKPFLYFLLTHLKNQGVTEVIFSTHFMSEKIQDYFGEQFQGIKIQYSVENQPLGTGGAIVQALTLVADKDKPVFVLNGDTFFKINYRDMYAQFHPSSFVMALRYIENSSRYGSVIIEDNKVKAFCEKGMQSSGFINAGVYLIKPTVFEGFVLPSAFSLEKDFLMPYLDVVAPSIFIANDYFIDIGIPEDYHKAVSELMV